jgi:hypothetical protein
MTARNSERIQSATSLKCCTSAWPVERQRRIESISPISESRANRKSSAAGRRLRRQHRQSPQDSIDWVSCADLLDFAGLEFDIGEQADTIGRHG